MACLVLGIRKIHGSGILHLDLKPENIVMKANGYCMITDFGISLKIGDPKAKEFDSGTPGYIAPEVMYYEEEYESYGVLFFC